MFLSNEVEIQLQEILTNRPNEEKEPTRRRNKKKDVIKNVKRGYGHNIERSIIDKQLLPIINDKLNELVMDDKKVYMVMLPVEEEIYHVDKMLNLEELEDLYYGYSVTQTKKGNAIELVARKYHWILTPLNYKPLRYTGRNGVFISSDIPDVDGIYKREYLLTNIKDIQLLPFVDKISDADISKLHEVVVNYHESKLINDIYSDKYKYIDKESSDILRTIEKSRNKSNWYNQEEIHIRRNELNAYIKKELERGGDFGKLDNRVDLFQTREYIY